MKTLKHWSAGKSGMHEKIQHVCCFSVDRYDYVVNGEALKEIHQYMEVEHTFSEYTEVTEIQKF